jgi:uncharacterized membrane protein HdeD (DUF308 family)
MAEPTIDNQIRELRLSAWVFGFFAVAAGIISVIDMYMIRRLDGGWPIVTLVAGMAWVFVIHVAINLRRVQGANERSNP